MNADEQISNNKERLIKLETKFESIIDKLDTLADDVKAFVEQIQGLSDLKTEVRGLRKDVDNIKNIWNKILWLIGSTLILGILTATIAILRNG